MNRLWIVSVLVVGAFAFGACVTLFSGIGRGFPRTPRGSDDGTLAALGVTIDFVRQVGDYDVYLHSTPEGRSYWLGSV